jgi:hypothetical protein
MESIRSYQEWAMSPKPRTVNWNNTYGAVALFPRSAVNLFHCFTITGRVGPPWLLFLMVIMSLAAFFTASAALKCDRSAKNEYTREYVAIEFLLVGVIIRLMHETRRTCQVVVFHGHVFNTLWHELGDNRNGDGNVHRMWLEAGTIFLGHVRQDP